MLLAGHPEPTLSRRLQLVKTNFSHTRTFVSRRSRRSRCRDPEKCFTQCKTHLLSSQTGDLQSFTIFFGFHLLFLLLRIEKKT